MDTITRPRTLTKAIATTALTLTVAGFATAFGIGLRGVLWEIKMATAELNKAAAAMEQAKATVSAAEKQAAAIIEGAKLAALASIEAARLGNVQEITILDKGTGPAVLEPLNEHTKLTHRIAVLNDELKTGLDSQTQQPIGPKEIKAREAELQVAGRRLGVIQNATQENTSGIVRTLFHAFAGAFGDLLPPAKPHPASQSNE